MAAMLWTVVTVASALLCLPDGARGAKCSEDGVLEEGCWGSITCEQGNIRRLTCQSGLVYDRVTRNCVEQAGRTAKCDRCEGRLDGVYPDVTDDCKTYFSCTLGASSEPLSCPPFLFFNKLKGGCDLKKNVPPPCGD